MSGGTIIRPVTAADHAPVTAIYNHYIVTTPATFDIEPFLVEERKEWFAQFRSDGPYRMLVAEEAGEVVGATWSSQFRPKRAYDTTVETSIYLAAGATGQGLGTQLYEALFAALAGESLHRAIAAITQPNEASTALHHRFGYRQVALLSEVGLKFGRYHDVAWLEKSL